MIKPLKNQKIGMQEWAKCKTTPDVIQWHKRFTPWFTEDQIIVIAQSYVKDLEELKKEQKRKNKQSKKKKQTLTQEQKQLIETTSEVQTKEENVSEQKFQTQKTSSNKNKKGIELQPAKLLTEFEKLCLKQ